VSECPDHPCHANAYIRLVNAVYPVALVIAIPYSADQKTLESLENSGIRTFLPANVEKAFLEAGSRVEEVLKSTSTPIIVQEVGGYLAGYTDKLASYPHFKGIVEDTNTGHWHYENAGEHKIPVVSMAQSPIKDIEDTVIGDSVVYSTERIFREEFHAVIQGVRSGVIGYGKIGTSTSIALKGRESPVSIYDIDPCKCIRARFEGLRISPLAQLLSESELIIGCTGKTSVREEDIPHIRDHAILVSGSAKNEEFDLDAFDKVCSREELSGVVWRYKQPDGRCFYVLNQGTPVNFRDRSILGYILDMIYSELFLCMELIANGNLSKGLQHSPAIIHTEVAKTWLEIYESAFSKDDNEKLWKFPESLSRALTHTFLLQTRVV
jgi:adenosylhomocysteinase